MLVEGHQRDKHEEIARIVTCAKEIVRFLPKRLIITKTSNEGIIIGQKQDQIKMI